MQVWRIFGLLHACINLSVFKICHVSWLAVVCQHIGLAEQNLQFQIYDNWVSYCVRKWCRMYYAHNWKQDQPSCIRLYEETTKLQIKPKWLKTAILCKRGKESCSSHFHDSLFSLSLISHRLFSFDLFVCLKSITK